MNKPFFTVVIPTHNRSKLLMRAIESVLNQTLNDFEIVIVDDNSTDDTQTIVKSIIDKRIIYLLNQRSKGACGARNTGIFTARGKWVAFLDDDDQWLPQKLENQKKVIDISPSEVGMICTDYTIYKGKRYKPILIKNRPSGWMKDKILYGYQIGCLSSTCVKIDILKKINGFDEEFPSNQDWDLWIRISQLCQVSHVPKSLVNMYQENRQDRIGQNYKAKLMGQILLKEKYSHLISAKYRLRHRHESLIFTYALLESKRRIIFNSMPWVLVGAFLDLYNFVRTIRTLIILINRKLKKF